VHVAFGAEQDPSSSGVLLLVVAMVGMPAVAGQLIVGAHQEIVALSFGLADEQNIGRFVLLSEVGVVL